MRISELEQRLNLQRGTIRFYEKQGLLSPKREENGYRRYSEADVAALETIVSLRKLGIPLADIKAVLHGTLPLHDAVDSNIPVLEKQIETLHGALEISRAMVQQDGTK